MLKKQRLSDFRTCHESLGEFFRDWGRKGNSWIFGFPFLDTPKTRSFLITKDFTIYDAVVNENATKQQCHWLRGKIIVLHVRTHFSKYSCVLFTATTWSHQNWGFDDNASVQMWIFNSLFSLTNRLYQFSFRILRPHCATRKRWIIAKNLRQCKFIFRSDVFVDVTVVDL